MTKFELGRHKASALTKKGAAVFITAAILALVMLFTACPQKAVSSKSAGPNVSSIFKTNGKGIITGYTCKEDELPKALVIPAKIEKEVIIGIGGSVFYGCKGLTSAVFANTNGWIVYKDSKYKTKHADINSTALADSSKAAKYLREKTANGGYSDKYWKKS